MKAFTYMKEIQNRLKIIILTFFLNICVLIFYKEPIFFILGQYQENNLPYFITTSLTEIFFAFFKLSLLMGLYFTIPIILIQIWAFLTPGLYQYEYQALKKFIYLSIFLYIVCTITTQYIIVPNCWKFFSSLEIKGQESIINIYLETRLKEYLEFYINIFLTLNIIFQSFLVFLILIKNLKINQIVRRRNYIYLTFCTMATIFSPPDVISQVVIGLGQLLIFEIFLFIMLINKGRVTGFEPVTFKATI